MVNRSDERGYIFGKSIQSALRITLAIRFVDVYYQVEEVMFLVYKEFLSLKDGVFCQMYFFASADRIMCFFFLVHWLLNIEPSLYSQDVVKVYSSFFILLDLNY